MDVPLGKEQGELLEAGPRRISQRRPTFEDSLNFVKWQCLLHGMGITPAHWEGRQPFLLPKHTVLASPMSHNETVASV